MVAQCLRLQHSQRDRGRALLAGRAEESEVLAVERQLEIVAVRADVRDASPQVERALFLVGGEQYIVARLRVGERAHIAHLGCSLLTDFLREV